MAGKIIDFARRISGCLEKLTDNSYVFSGTVTNVIEGVDDSVGKITLYKLQVGKREYFGALRGHGHPIRPQDALSGRIRKLEFSPWGVFGALTFTTNESGVRLYWPELKDYKIVVNP